MRNLPKLRFHIILILSFLFTFVVSSCSSEKRDSRLIEELEVEISESKKLLFVSNENILETLKVRKVDAKTADKAAIWLPKAQSILASANQIVARPSELKQRILGASKNNLQKELDEEIGAELDKHIASFRQKLLSVDSNLTAQLLDDTGTKNVFFESSIVERVKGDYISQTKPQEFVALLTKIENKALRTANKCLLYCLDRTTLGCVLEFEVFEAIIGQNAKILEAGDELEITTGLGTISRSKAAQITIGKTNVALNDKGLAIFKMRTNKKAGTYSLPVKVAYTDQDGKAVERTFAVEYKLVDALKD